MDPTSTKGNILKPTFDTLTEEGHKVFKVYRANLKELFLSRCEVTRYGTSQGYYVDRFQQA
jgi:hypothetical protein